MNMLLKRLAGHWPARDAAGRRLLGGVLCTFLPLLALLTLLTLSFGMARAVAGNPALVLTVQDAIGPASADYIVRV